MIISDDKKQDFMQELDLLLSAYGASIEVRDEYQGFGECGEDIHARIYCEGFDVDLGSFYAPPPSCANQGPGDDFVMGILKALRWCATDADADLDIIADAITRIESGGEL